MIPDAYDIYAWLWDCLPEDADHLCVMRMYHSLCPDEYNDKMFRLVDDNSYLQVVIATAGFGQGVSQKKLLDSILWGAANTLDMQIQRNSHIGRDEADKGQAIIVMPTKVVTQAEKFLKELKTGAVNGPTVSKKTKKASKKAKLNTINDERLAHLLTKKHCLTAAHNIKYGNPPLEETTSNCHIAKCQTYCGLCTIQHNWETILRQTQTMQKKKDNLDKHEWQIMMLWMLDFHQCIWRAAITAPN
ncbi:atp-dependent dna helicase [Moniliophthora roreri MCA 2997]|uniref:Atp-dependent dna helicase n=2 Tax=Moniliophthora roreri TaxID=221103 RepID=V2WNG9_MONRO|nr:atp-dependent dna helicase [Moniliophthora roreri MCA 2997]